MLNVNSSFHRQGQLRTWISNATLSSTNFQGRDMDLVECLSFLFQISFATLGKVLL